MTATSIATRAAVGRSTDNGGWNSLNRPSQLPQGTTGRLGGELSRPGQLDSATRNQLNRDQFSRNDGAQRTRDLGAVRSGGAGAGSIVRAAAASRAMAVAACVAADVADVRRSASRYNSVGALTSGLRRRVADVGSSNHG